MKWLAIMLSKLLMWVWSFLLYPLTYYARNGVREWYYNGSRLKKVLAFPLWIVLDDESDYGEGWFRADLPNGLWKSWLWAFVRNNSWNWNQVVRVVHGGREFTIREKVWGFKDASALEHRRFKWEVRIDTKDGYTFWGDWNTNQGDRLSQERTWLGGAWCTYMVLKDGRTYGRYWRYSYAGIHGPIMINIKAGYNKRGEALLDFKLKRFRKYYTKHWI